MTPAMAIQLPSLPLTPLVLERFIEALPAMDRAQFRWAPKRLHDLASELLRTELTPDLIRGRARAAYVVVIDIERALFASQRLGRFLEVASTPGIYEGAFGRLLQHVEDTLVEDAVQWAAGALRRLLEEVSSQLAGLQKEQLADIAAQALSLGNEQQLDASFNDTFYGDFWCTSLALLALEDALASDVPPTKLDELAEYAYFFASTMVARAQSEVGLNLDPEASLPPAERLKRFRRAAEVVSRTFSPEDFAVLREARLSDLR